MLETSLIFLETVSFFFAHKASGSKRFIVRELFLSVQNF